MYIFHIISVFKGQTTQHNTWLA